MFPNEGAEDLDNGRVVSCGFDGDALQVIDAAEADITSARTELLDALDVALRELPSSSRSPAS